MIGDITVDDPDCVVKLRTRSIMTAIKFPGYPTFTSYAHAKHLSTNHILSMP